MRRVGVRLSMLVVGLSVAALYLAAAVVLLRLFAVVFEGATDLVTTGVVLAATTVLLGYLSYRFGTVRTLAGLDVVELPRERAPALFERLDRLSDAMGVDRPRLLVGELGAPNAFTLGGGRWGTIVVDRSLFGLLAPDEFEAVLAHELAHLASYDSLLKTLAYSAVQTVTGVVFVCSLPLALALAGLARGVAWAAGRPVGWTATPFARLHRAIFDSIGVVLFVLVVALFAHSRRREFAADDRAARVTGNPLALASGLRQLEVATDRWLLSSLTVRGPDDHPLTRLLSTHPPVEARIDRLVRLANRQ